MKIRLLSFCVLLLFVCGCSAFTITKKDLVNQFKKNQKQKVVFQYIPVGGIASMFISDRFKSNQIDKILCYNSDGEKVYLYPDKNTELEIIKKIGW